MTPFRYRPRHLVPRPKGRAAAAVMAAATVSAAAPAARASTYVVRPGDTLSEIARRGGTTVARLAARNDIADPDRIVIGDRLDVPAGAAATHTVSRGETLSAIAARYGTTVEAIARLNRLADPNLIVAGRSLRIPDGGLPAEPAGVPAGGATAVGVEAVLDRHAAAHGLDRSLVKAVAWQESGWQQDVVSDAGAIGVMQVMPGTADYVNATTGHRLDVRSADGNVHLGVMYLARMQAQMGSTRKALAAYYAGPGNVGRRLTPGQHQYADAVLAHQDGFR